jgi:hypothetical protein
MKKLLLTLLAAGLSATCFGQGLITFKNVVTSGATVNAPVYLDTVGGAKLDSAVNSLWRAVLLLGPTTGTAAYVGHNSLPSNPSGTDNAGNLNQAFFAANTTISWVTFRSGTSTAVGAGVINVGTSSSYTDGSAPNSQRLAQVVAWQGNFTTWAAAFSAAQSDTSVKIGASNAILVTLNGGSTDTFLPTLSGLQAFAIVAVPEPATFALFGLGAASLLIFRRRK